MKNPAAVALGSIRTPKKSDSSRQNGKLGGRPKVRKMLIGVLKKCANKMSADQWQNNKELLAEVKSIIEKYQ